MQKTICKKMLGKGLVKGGLARIGKRLPIIGAILGTAFAIDRARKGDFMGAGLKLFWFKD